MHLGAQGQLNSSAVATFTIPLWTSAKTSLASLLCTVCLVWSRQEINGYVEAGIYYIWAKHAAGETSSVLEERR